jgi:hypothetical protein
MKIRNSYQRRPVRKIALVLQDGWAIKAYSISVKNDTVSGKLSDLARVKIFEELKHIDIPVRGHRIGILILHEGIDGIYTLLNWWTDENILCNQVYFSTYQKPEDFSNLSEKSIVACVWELAVLWHERNSWIANILMKNGQPDYDSYLNDFLSEDV